MTSLSRRPATLHEVASRVASDQQGFDPAVREFLDTFYAAGEGREAALASRPSLLGGVKDAYLAALGEHLARANGMAVPTWTDNHGTRLRRPFFAGGLESLKAVLTVESPTAFRRRMLFVSKDALDRPRRRFLPCGNADHLPGRPPGP